MEGHWFYQTILLQVLTSVLGDLRSLDVWQTVDAHCGWSILFLF